MNSKSTDIQDIETIAQKAHDGEDVSEHFTGRFQVKQNVTIDFPLDLLRSIDIECKRHNLSRQDWIKRVCAEQVQTSSLKEMA
jgi:hypothetical protein